MSELNKVINSEEMIEKAKKYFHGSEGYNCVQAVLKVFQEEYSITEEILVEGKAFGGGRAKDGVCGALYAIGMIDKDLYSEVEKDFESAAGSLKCSDIKSLEKLSCRECVGYSVERALEKKKNI